GRSPRAWTAERFAGRDEMPHEGIDSVTVPGAVSSWLALSERFGALPFEELFAPAVRYAREGFCVSPWTAEGWARGVERFSRRQDFLACFAPSGRAPFVGERVSLPAHAATLEDIARTRGRSFYEGALAERIALHAEREGGVLSREDLLA